MKTVREYLNYRATDRKVVTQTAQQIREFFSRYEDSQIVRLQDVLSKSSRKLTTAVYYDKVNDCFLFCIAKKREEYEEYYANFYDLANYFADDETSDDEIYNNFLVFVVERENLRSESHILEHASKFDEI